jgi:uncharacterized protein YdhG (YjbR/CyaY superfamily)
MQSKAASVEEYLKELPEDRLNAMTKIRNLVKNNLPKGFEESMQYGMITYVVPHSVYPNGYHCNPKDALPFMSIASQKNFISLYHMGVYADEKLLNWVKDEYAKQCKTKLDMGKGCIRFKKMDDIPYQMIEELASKISVDDWIAQYEMNFKR